MGVPNTKQAIGGMVINLEKPYYYPGEIVHGKIYCLFSQPYDCKSVEMEISAEEYTMFTEKKRRERAKETSINKREGRNCIYKRVQTIMVPEKNIINQGHYVYPFTFMLPLNLPGSFESYSDEHSAYIKHIVEVRALPLDPNTQATTNSILFIVRQPPQFFQYPSKMTDSKYIKICCLNKGTSSVTVSLEKNYYTTDDKVNVICELDNTKCSLDIKSIKLELFQEIILKDKNERVQNISRKVSEYSFLSYNKAGHESIRTIELQLQDSKNPCKDFKHKCEHPNLFKDVNLIPLLQATVTSSLITCHYYFKVKTEFRSFFSISETPTIDIPIIIYIPDIRSNIQIYQPHNWNPQIMNNMEITFLSLDESKLPSKQNVHMTDFSRTENFNVSYTNSDGNNHNCSSLNLREYNRKPIIRKQTLSENITCSDRSFGKAVHDYKSSFDSNADHNLLALLQKKN